MHRFVPPLVACLLLTCSAQSAHSQEPIKVAASIKPIHSLVSMVMEGVGEPALIVQSTGSEHVYSLRPSDAEALDAAQLVFWVGEGMETFLVKPLESLAADAFVVALEDAPGLEKLRFREGGPFDDHVHEEQSGEHSHEEEESAARQNDAEDSRADGVGAEHAQDIHEAPAAEGDEEAGQFDLHFWLDPKNAKVLLEVIASRLAEADPANAQRYAENAMAHGKRLDELAAEIEAQLAPVREKPFIVFHDAYQYFERRFGLAAAGSITVSPEVMPGAQRVGEIREKVKSLGVACVFSEPQFEPKLVTVVTEGTDARSGILDPLGSVLEDGPDLYAELLRQMATSLETCLSGEG